MSAKDQQIDDNLYILNVQMDVLTKFVGYLASYTVDDDEIEHVKKYVDDKVMGCRNLTGVPKDEIKERIAASRVWEQIKGQIE